MREATCDLVGMDRLHRAVSYRTGQRRRFGQAIPDLLRDAELRRENGRGDVNAGVENNSQRLCLRPRADSQANAVRAWNDERSLGLADRAVAGDGRDAVLV